jgi:hypothetical protein
MTMPLVDTIPPRPAKGGATALRLLRALLVIATLRLSSLPVEADTYSPPDSDAFLASNQPDKFAWQLFVEICRPAKGAPGDLNWETWALEADIFKDSKVAPQWPTGGPRPKRLFVSAQQRKRAVEESAEGTVPPIPKDRDGVANEEVRINEDAFNYVVKHDLWYKEGIVAKTTDGTIEFPKGSIAIKGKWKQIDASQKERFHWHEYEDPTTHRTILVGLVALHISSRILPTWHWSTFEQVDNPGLADYIGLYDSYGMTPNHSIAPNATTNQGYADKVGTLADELASMMDKAGLSAPLKKYYRLKGSQIAFTDATGRATLLGNSVTEAGFVATSSCITCHSRATIGAPYQGQNQFPVPPPLSVFTKGGGQSFNGAPRPEWFWYPTAPYSEPVARPEPSHKQVEFLWQFVFSPKARAEPKTPTSLDTAAPR